MLFSFMVYVKYLQQFLSHVLMWECLLCPLNLINLHRMTLLFGGFKLWY